VPESQVSIFDKKSFFKNKTLPHIMLQKDNKN
jgi:hypothetical protein